jgi:hypothetical protein
MTSAATAASVGGFGLGAKLALVIVGASVAAGGTMFAVHARESASTSAQTATASAARPAMQPAAAATTHAPAEQPAPSATEARPLQAPVAQPLATSTRAVDTRPSRPMRSRFAATRRAPHARTAVTSEPVAPPPTASTAVEPPIDASLREELAIIARANTALRLEHPADALRALDEHARRFESGVLSEERRGLRVLALCQLSPNQAALDARDAFLRSTPNALLAPKVRAACVADPKEGRR